MIKPSKTIVTVGATSAAVILVALVAGRRRSTRRAGCALGLGGLGYAAWAWHAADVEDRNITRNPEVMNGHFLTAGGASAVNGNLADVGYLRELMGMSPATGGPRGNRLR